MIESGGKTAAGKAAVPLMFVPALVCAGISMILMRAGFFTIFSLVPLGVCALMFGPAAAWLSALAAALGNGLWSMGLSLHNGGLSFIGLDTLFFTVLILGFTWIMAGRLPMTLPVIPPVRTAFRFIAAAVAGALVFSAVIFSLLNNEDFSAGLHSQIEALSAFYISSAGTDAAQQAFMERTLTSDRIIQVFSMVVLRGGALVSALFLLFFNRQTTFIVMRLFRRSGGSVSGDLIGFHVPRRAIWVFSLCLPVILLCRISALELIEIAAWNILIICATMFLAQGGGIVLFNLARRQWPMMARLFCGVMVIFVLFSPGINVFALVMLMLLGIAENWLPLRIVKLETPGA